MILLATPGRSLDILIEDQLRTIMARQKANPIQVGYFIAEQRRSLPPFERVPKFPVTCRRDWRRCILLISVSSCTARSPPTRSSSPSHLPARCWLSMALRTCRYPRTRMPNAIDAALKERSPDDHAFVLIDGASHNLKHVKSADDAGFSGEMDVMALREITSGRQ